MDFVKLGMESLEERTLMATAPFITSVTPTNATSIFLPSPILPPPALTVNFSEDMLVADVSNANNYFIFNSEGLPVTVNSAAYSNNGGAGPFTVTIGYNDNNPIPADVYTLLLLGDQIHSVAGVAMTPPGQVVISNQESNTISVVGVNGANDTKLQAATNFSVGDAPLAIELVDHGLLIGDLVPSGVLDLLVASRDPDNNQYVINIFSARNGGGFFTTPTATLDLPQGSIPTDITVGNFDNPVLQNGLDIAVSIDRTSASGNGEVTVFMSILDSSINYGLGTSITASAVGPVAIHARDMDADGNLDLAVANNRGSPLIVYVLPGDGLGGFGAPSNHTIILNPTNPLRLTGMAAFGVNDPNEILLPDLAVTTNFGEVVFLNNTSVVGTVTFAQNFLPPTNIFFNHSAFAVIGGDINKDGNVDIVTLENGGRIQAWLGPTFGAPPVTLATLTPAPNGAGRLAIADLDEDGGNEVIITSGDIANRVTVLHQSATTPGLFDPAVNYVTGQGPGPVAIGDTNSDTILDVVTGNRSGNSATVFRGATTNGQPDGTFWDDTKYSTGVGLNDPKGIASGDLNGDGLPDVVVAKNANDEIGVLLSTGTLDGHGLVQYGPMVNYVDTLNGDEPVRVALGDFDGINGLDIAAVFTETSNVIIFFNDGLGGFAVAPHVIIPVGENPEQIVVGQFDADNTLDFAVTHNEVPDTGITLVFGAGGGAFQTPIEIGFGSRPVAIATADFNQDGKPDLAVANNKIGNEKLDVYLGNGFGTFTLVSSHDISDSPTSIAIGDMNRDGFADVVVSSGGSGPNSNNDNTNNDLNLLINSQGVGFDPAIPITMFEGAMVQSVVVSNVNIDPFPDLIVTLIHPPLTTTDISFRNNVYQLVSRGDGSFKRAEPFFAGGQPLSPATQTPSFLALAADPLITATTFDVHTTLVAPNLVRNGTFDIRDLNAENGTLTSWQVFSQENSAGGWNVQTPNDLIGASTSPLLQLPVSDPVQGSFSAMMDQADITLPITGPLFAGAHALYQDVSIPIDDPLRPTDVRLSYALSYETAELFSNTTLAVPQPLDYSDTLTPNTQIRVDLIDAPIQFTDSFDRLNNTNLGNDWAEIVGNFEIENEKLVTKTPLGDLAFFTRTRPTNVILEVDVEIASLSGPRAGLVARATSPNDYYVAELSGIGVNSILSISRVVGGNATLLSAVTAAVNKGKIRFEVTGNRFKLFFNNVLRIDTTDTSASAFTAAGSVGIIGRSAKFDNFSMKTVALSPMDVGTSVLQNVFITDPGMPLIQPYVTTTLDMNPYKGRTVRIRFATTNNKGNMVVGVDNVRLTTTYIDSSAPTVKNVVLRNPGFGANSSIAGITSDATIIGKVDDNGTPANIRFIEAIATNADDGTTVQARTNKIDSLGNFSLTLPITKPGTYYVTVQATDRADLRSTIANHATTVPGRNTTPLTSEVQTVTIDGTGDPFILNFKGKSTPPLAFDLPASGGLTALDSVQKALEALSTIGAGNVAVTKDGNVYTIRFRNALANTDVPQINSATITFALQGPSVTTWEAQGPGPIATRGVNYPTVSGRVTSIAVDPRDASGNTFYVGSANGGVWKTTNGGHDYIPLTDRLTDSAGNAINVPVGSIAINPVNPNLVYVGLGVADTAHNSYPGQGILKSTDAGRTWTLIGTSVFDGARISKIAVAGAIFNAAGAVLEPERIYVAVAVGGAGPGLYRSEDGGTTWVSVMNPDTNMFLSLPGGGPALPPGTPLASVTDVVIDPFNPERIYVGIGNIGLLPGNISAGGWRSPNHGGQWEEMFIGKDLATPNNLLPAGGNVGRVTIATGNGRLADSSFVYVLMTNAAPFPLAAPPNSTNTGNFQRGDFFLTGLSAGLFASRNGGNDWTDVKLRQELVFGGAADYQDIDLFNNDGGYAGAVVVDPQNPFVVYVGGSRRLSPQLPVSIPQFASADTLIHSFIRVDTRDMRDHFTPSNDGNSQPNVGFTQVVGVPWYDLQRNVGNGYDFGERVFTTIPDRLPGTIHELVVDPQGRLLIGTEGGIWRGNTVGFAYSADLDRTDPSGRGRRRLPLQGSNLMLTPLNGNLQIADLNSVAIDPTDRDTIYSAQAGTGFARTAGPLTWQSMAMFTTNMLQTDQPYMLQTSGGRVVVAPPAPGSPPGTPSRVYTTWEYSDFLNGSGVQVSAAGGAFGSFQPIISGLESNDLPGLFLPIALNPNKDFTIGTPQDELVYGTDTIYRTVNSGNSWDRFPDPIFTPAQGRISAVAVAPSGTHAYYIGTDQGRMFIDLLDGGNPPPPAPPVPAFPDRTSNLPGTAATPINDIAVFPGQPLVNTMVTIGGTTYERQQIAFVALGGFDTNTGHVWRTTDAGLSWTDVSAGLPDVPAYSVVVSDKAQLGGQAGAGAVYVATHEGVFYSIDFGTTWKRLGQGMPNVPVVDLQHNPDLDVLVAGTRGRGAFTIDTSVISFIPDQVTPEDTPTSVPFTVNDPGGLPTGFYSITTLSSNGALIPNSTDNLIIGGTGQNRTIRIIPAPNANGVCDVTIFVKVGSTVIGQQTFQVTVNSVNDLPTVKEVVIVEGEPTLVEITTPRVMLQSTSHVINLEIGDVEDLPATLIATATSSNPALVPDLPANLSVTGTGISRTLTITPLAGQTGETVITLSILDSDGGITVRTIHLLVSQNVLLPFTDNFNRPDNSLFFGPGWNVNVGSFTTTGNQASAGAGASIATLKGLSAADVALQASVNVPLGKDFGFVARYAGVGNKNYYAGRITTVGNLFKATISKNVNGITTILTTVTIPSGTGTLRFEVVGTSLKLFFAEVAGPMTLAAWVHDSTFKLPGTAGIYSAIGNISADDFLAEAITLTPPFLEFTDSFTQGDFSALTRNWLERSGRFDVQTFELVARGTGVNLATVNGAIPDGFVQADISALNAGQTGGVVARYSASGYYLAMLSRSGASTLATLYRVTSTGVLVKLSASAVVPTAAGTLRLEFAGPQLKLFHGPVGGPSTLLRIAYDTLLTTGNTGIRAAKDVKIDEFVTNAVLLAPPVLTFNDSFGLNDGDPLSPNWSNKAGDFRVQSGVLVSNLATSIATVNGVLPNSSIQADLVVGATTGQQAGVIARYSAAGYYYAQILKTSTGTGMLASIYRVSSTGVMTLLASAPVATGPGTIRFEVVGTSLKLFYGPNAGNLSLVTYAFNTTLTTGTSGIRASKGTIASPTTIDNVELSEILVLPAAVPFTDDFTLGTALSREWTERAGNYSINAGGILVSNHAAINLATINIALGNSSIQADIVVGANQQAGLVAHYNPANNSMYLALIRDVTIGATTKITATLFKVIGSTMVQLSVPVTVTSGTGTLRFEIVGSNLKLFYGPVGAPALVAFGYDSSLAATGFAGIRSTKNATYDNINVNAITVGVPTLPFSDSFPTTPGDQLSRDWEERAGNFTVDASGPMKGIHPTLNQATVRGLVVGNTGVQAEVVVGANQQAGVVARLNAANGATYYAQIRNSTIGAVSTNFATIYKFSGTLTPISTAVVIPAVGAGTSGLVRLEVVGNNLKLFYTPTGGSQALATFAYDATPLAAGLAGIRSSGGATIDNFLLEAVSLGTPTLPFADDFSTPGIASQLSFDWQERSGNFVINAGELNANSASLNLATVNLTAPDVAVQANVAVPLISGKNAGLVARYSTTGYYLAQLSRSGSVYVVTIFRSVNGVLTQLAAPVQVALGNGTMRFEVAGPSLKVFYGPVAGTLNLVAFAYDSTFTTGASGVRLTTGSTIDAFDLSAIMLNVPFIPFTDAFALPNGSPISRDWTERSGLFQINAAEVLTYVSATSINLATVNGASLVETSVQADVDVGPALGNQAGVIARYSSTGYYLAVIRNAGLTAGGNLYEAQIFRVLGNTFTPLGTAKPVDGVDGIGLLRLDVAGTSLKLYYKNALVAYANDSIILGPGTAGIRTIGSTVDNFMVAPITLGTPNLPFMEFFTQPAGAELSVNWIVRAGLYRINNVNQAVGLDAGLNIATVNGPALPNASVNLDVNLAPTEDAGAVLRYNPTNGSYYFGRIISVGAGFNAQILKVVGGVTTTLKSVAVASGLGSLRFEVAGNNLKLFYGPVGGPLSLVAFAFDTALTTGATGIRSKQNAKVDNFVTDAIALATIQTLPFSETFVANPPSQQLSNNWLEQAGNFNVSTGKAAGQAAVNLATLNGFSAADVDIQMAFAFSSVSQSTSLVARYSGPLERNMYLATITWTNPTTFTISIGKNVNGVSTLLGQVIHTTTTGVGDFRFQVVGDTLKVYIDGFDFPILTVKDKAPILGAGTVGMRVTQDVEVTSFSAN